MSTKQMIIIMINSLLVVLCITAAIIVVIEQKEKKLVKNNLYIRRRYHRKSKLIQLYEVLECIPIINNYLYKIKKKFEIICPEEKKILIKKTMWLTSFIWILSSIVLSYLFLSDFSFYHLTLSFISIYVIHNEISYNLLKYHEVKLLKQLEKFLADVRHNYYVSNMVDIAIKDSLIGAGAQMKVHGMLIYEVLCSTDIHNKVSKYNDKTYNKFLKIFLAQCVNVVEYGDKEVNATSLFLINIMNLRIDIQIDILRRNKTIFLFSGLSIVSILPLITLDWIKEWGLSNLPELASFYNGKVGFFTLIFLVVLSLITYVLVDKLREEQDYIPSSHDLIKKLANIGFIKQALNNYEDKSYGRILKIDQMLKRMGETLTAKQLLLKRILFGITIGILSFAIMNYIHYKSRVHTLNHTIGSKLNITNKEMVDELQGLIKSLVLEFRDDAKVSKVEILEAIRSSEISMEKAIEDILVDEVLHRKDKYREDYFKWYEAIIVFALSYIGYFLPYWLLLYKRKIIDMSMHDEVIQFQSIILMLMYIERMTTKTILETMETFALIFRPAIRECLNDYNSGDIEALERLREKESFGPFRQLIDDFLIADKIQISKAFDEIAADRLNYQETRKQENEIKVTKKAEFAMFISYIPATFILGMYLIIPFAYESLKQLNQYTMEMNGMF